MQVRHTLVEAPCNPQCVGAYPKLKAGTIRNTTSATQEHDKCNTRTQTSTTQHDEVA
jgi:hypothetical protein